MLPPKTTYNLPSDDPSPVLREDHIEFGFIGKPIFETNASSQKIEDGNVLRFHIDYFKVEGASSSHKVASSKDSKQEQDAPAAWAYFNPHTEIDIHRGDLPHWEQDSAWYFVTFRLADSLPQSVVDELKAERDYWKQTHDLDNLTPEQLAEENKAAIAQVLPEENLRGFKGQYLETAKKLKESGGSFQLPSSSQGAGGSLHDQIDFEFVLFASAVIDYDYIMDLIAKFSAKEPGKSKMTREELIEGYLQILISLPVIKLHQTYDI